MKKIFLIIPMILFFSPAFAQTTIYNNNSANPVASGVGNAMGINRTQNNYMNNGMNNMPATMPPMGNTQGSGIKTLEQRRMERMQKQNDQLRKSGINIQQIPNPQQGNVMNIQPNTIQGNVRSVPGVPLQNNQPVINNGTMQNAPVGTGY